MQNTINTNTLHFITLSETEDNVLLNPKVLHNMDSSTAFIDMDLYKYPNILQLLGYQTNNEGQNYKAYHFNINENDLTTWALNIIAYISFELGSFSDDDDYCDNLPSLIQELWLILKQWPEQYKNHSAYLILNPYYKNLKYLYDENEVYNNPQLKFTTFYFED